MFQTAIIDMFIPMGNSTSADDIAARINEQSKNRATGELLVRLFEYQDPKVIIPIVQLGDVIVINPDVFPCGRHLPPDAYEKLVKQTFKGIKCDVIDIGPPTRPECKTKLSATGWLFWYAGRSEAAFINGSCHIIFNEAKGGILKTIRKNTAVHKTTVSIKFIPGECKQVRDPIPVVDWKDNLPGEVFPEMKLTPTVNPDSLRADVPGLML